TRRVVVKAVMERPASLGGRGESERGQGKPSRAGRTGLRESFVPGCRRAQKKGLPGCSRSRAGPLRIGLRGWAAPRTNYSPVYGSRAMKRARLTASVTACWLAAEHPVL